MKSDKYNIGESKLPFSNELNKNRLRIGCIHFSLFLGKAEYRKPSFNLIVIFADFILGFFDHWTFLLIYEPNF